MSCTAQFARGILPTVVLLSVSLVAPAHADDFEAGKAEGLKLFSGGVRTLLIDQCGKCHTGEDIEAELDLSTREGLLKGGTSGAAVIPGKAANSLLYKLITHQKKPHMPQDADQLSDQAIADIARWIDLGAPYDKPLVDPAVSAAWTRRTVADDAKQFWSFQPLRRAEPPAATDAEVRTPIDRFVRAKQAAAGVSPNPPVDRRQLIRRACFDLIGLPPTPEEVVAFVNDTAPDAYERLLDRLLASEHYGERWARHWLDLARFAESHGYEHDTDRPSAYHYRDFVIQALNRDLPYDTFVKWQLAGDEYEPENNLALMATGYLAAGVHSTQITKNEVEKHRYDEMDDMLATVGTSLLGLSIGCARCHDHKFDPIPAADYYRLLSTFTTTVRSEVDLNFDKAAYTQAKANFDAGHAPLVAAVAKYEAEQLPGSFAAWEATNPNPPAPAWTVLESEQATSGGGATLTRLDDGSLLATGVNPKFDRYELVARTTLTGIRSLRIEALSDPSLVKGGPGRAANGNFALTHLKVTIADKDGKNPQEVKLKNPRATFEQAGLPVAAAIDGDPKSAWAVDPEFGKDHAAAFELETPVGSAAGATLSVSLIFTNNDGHNFGRTRVAVSTSEKPPDLRGDSLLQTVQQALATPAAERNAEQQAALLKWHRHRDPQWSTLNSVVQEHLKKQPQPNLVKVLISTEGLPAVRLNTQGGDFLDATHFLRRGDPNNRDGTAEQGFLQVLMRTPEAETHWPARPPEGWRTSYRRRALAEWLCDVDQGAGALLARVIVNRLWQLHLGRGIVATPSDFGTRGSPPTHPELLDWLAYELIAGGWKLKPLHKQIMLSATYQQGPQNDPAKFKIDADNTLVWRRPRRRLEAEVIRDSILAVSGLLDRKPFGPGTLDAGTLRRSIYFTVKRSQLVPMMQVFDCPDALSGIPERPTTTIAPQALLLMNNENIRKAAHAFAKRLAPEGRPATDECLNRGYLSAVGRTATPDELAAATAFIERQTASYAGKPDAAHAALTDFCHVLLCLNEFMYVD